MRPERPLAPIAQDAKDLFHGRLDGLPGRPCTIHSMASDPPVLLRLPFWLVDVAFNLERLLASDASRSWSRSWSLLPKFELSGPERIFARELLTKKRNLWLFRCHQQTSTGDFAVVDMSSSSSSHRRAYLVELKNGATLRLGGKGACGQMQNADRALDELRRQGIAEEIHELLSGDGKAVLNWFGAGVST